MYDYEGFGGSSGSASLLNLLPDLDVTDRLDAADHRSRPSHAFRYVARLDSNRRCGGRTAAASEGHYSRLAGGGAGRMKYNSLIRGRAAVIAVLEPWLLTENTIRELTQPAAGLCS